MSDAVDRFSGAPTSSATNCHDVQYASKLYGEELNSGAAEDDDSDAEGGDIEAEIKKEVDDIRKPAVAPLFTSVKLDTQCCKLHYQGTSGLLANTIGQYCFSKHASR
jgi:tRNA acetyltransferase TAN1